MADYHALDQVYCRQCGTPLPSSFGDHPWCAWCTKEAEILPRWQHVAQPGYGRVKIPGEHGYHG